MSTDLLKIAKTRWLFGDWKQLLRLSNFGIENHPDRGKLALYIAAASAQEKRPDLAARWMRLSKTWGCCDQEISRVMVSGVYETLARARDLSNDTDKASSHRRTALKVGMPDDDHKLIAWARQHPEASARRDTSVCARERLNLPALSRYTSNHDRKFLYVDTKSLPRSGLHYLNNGLQNILGEDYSFCEWYQQDNCCRQSPCRRVQFSSRIGSGAVYLRLIKSHDFDLDDPWFPTSDRVLRLTLIRDPLFVLSSWAVLDLLRQHRSILDKRRVSLLDIYRSHDKKLVDRAYTVVGENFSPLSESDLVSWVRDKMDYILGFLDKWAVPRSDREKVTMYQEMPSVVVDIVEKLGPLSREQNVALSRFKKAGGTFRPRCDAFLGPNEVISEWLMHHRELFVEAASEICETWPALKG